MRLSERLVVVRANTFMQDKAGSYWIRDTELWKSQSDGTWQRIARGRVIAGD